MAMAHVSPIPPGQAPRNKSLTAGTAAMATGFGGTGGSWSVWPSIAAGSDVAAGWLVADGIGSASSPPGVVGGYAIALNAGSDEVSGDRIALGGVSRKPEEPLGAGRPRHS